MSETSTAPVVSPPAHLQNWAANINKGLPETVRVTGGMSVDIHNEASDDDVRVSLLGLVSMMPKLKDLEINIMLAVGDLLHEHAARMHGGSLSSAVSDLEALGALSLDKAERTYLRWAKMADMFSGDERLEGLKPTHLMRASEVRPPEDAAKCVSYIKKRKQLLKKVSKDPGTYSGGWVKERLSELRDSIEPFKSHNPASVNKMDLLKKHAELTMAARDWTDEDLAHHEITRGDIVAAIQAVEVDLYDKKFIADVSDPDYMPPIYVGEPDAEVETENVEPEEDQQECQEQEGVTDDADGKGAEESPGDDPGEPGPGDLADGGGAEELPEELIDQEAAADLPDPEESVRSEGEPHKEPEIQDAGI